ncbi:hypothetical protein BKA69DRAFT_1169794 [Paraphysoderma sedebokerense]|nr:hypothetical protein BKA69DRAFT_1169794 [Paraphysoderma sedebokerense]
MVAMEGKNNPKRQSISRPNSAIPRPHPTSILSTAVDEPGKHNSSRIAQSCNLINALIQDIKSSLIRPSSGSATHCQKLLDEIQIESKKLTQFELTYDIREFTARLDSYGVDLWNKSVELKLLDSETAKIHISQQLVAHLRETALGLICLAAAQNKDEKTLLKLLNLANKTTKDWLEQDEQAKADKQLDMASTIQERIMRCCPSPPTLQRIKLYTSFYLLKAESAWKHSTPSVAQYMLEQAVLILKSVAKDPGSTDLLLSIAKQANVFGQSKHQQASDDSLSNSGSIKWFRFAFSLLDSFEFQDDGSNCSNKIVDFKIQVLTSMATEYMQLIVMAASTSSESNKGQNGEDDNYGSAIKCVDAALNLKPSIALHYLKVKLLTLTKKNDKVILQELSMATELIELKPSPMEIYLAMIHYVCDYVSNSSIALLHLSRAIEILLHRMTPTQLQSSNQSAEVEVFYKFVMTKIHFIAKREDSNDGEGNGDDVKSVKTDEVKKLITELQDKIPMQQTFLDAINIILWQTADRYFQSKQYQTAITWYHLSSQMLITKRGVGRHAETSNAGVVYRKIALCHLELNQLHQASEAIRKAQTFARMNPPQSESESHSRSKGDASNSFVLFLIYLYRGLEDEAIQCLQDMISEDGFHVDMLSAALYEAKQKRSMTVVRQCLQDLLLHVRGDEEKSVSILRCLVKVLVQQDATGLDHIDEIVAALTASESYFAAWRKKHTTSSIDENAVAKITARWTQNMQWFLKNAWNIGLQCAKVSDDKHTSILFEMVYKFLNLMPDGNEQTRNEMKIACFIIVATKLKLSRAMTESEERTILWEEALEYLRQCQTFINSSSITTKDELFTVQLIPFKFELNLKLGYYDSLADIIERASQSKNQSAFIIERLADLVIRDDKCPSSTVMLVLQDAIAAILGKPKIDYVRFGQFFRLMIIAALENDKNVAHGFFQQNLEMISRVCREDFPQIEIQWLALTAWNCGVEYYSGKDYRNAKVWMELALAHLPLLKNQQLYEAEMRPTYTELLELL